MRSLEKNIIFSAYSHVLGLEDKSTSSTYRDALVDARTECMENYGGCTNWQMLANATMGHPWCPMWKLQCLRGVLTTYAPDYPSSGLSGAAVNENVTEELEACRAYYLNIVQKDGRSYRNIWKWFRFDRLCMFHEHSGETCVRPRVETVDIWPECSENEPCSIALYPS